MIQQCPTRKFYVEIAIYIEGIKVHSKYGHCCACCFIPVSPSFRSPSTRFKACFEARGAMMEWKSDDFSQKIVAMDMKSIATTGAGNRT